MRALAVAFLLLAPGAAWAEQGMDLLLRDLNLAPVVAVQAARGADGTVVVTLTPGNGAKLVADPGISVVPLDGAGRQVGPTAALRDPAREYFALSPSLTVPLGTAERLRVEYAYCVVARQCLFGDTTVMVPPI